MLFRSRGFTAANQKLAEHMGGYGLDPNDHMNGPKFLAAQAGEFDPMKRRVQEAQISAQNASAMSNRAHAGYYQAATEAAKAKAAPAPAPTQAENLDSYNIDAAGNLIRPGGAPSSPFPNFKPSDAGVPVNRSMPDPMRLGGPRDDIAASMRLDEGRPQPKGVQVAQAGPPSLMDQARMRVRQRPEPPSAENLNPLGLSDDGVRDVVLSNKIAASLGKPKVGHIWSLDDKGRPVQKKIDEKGPAAKDMSPEQIQFNLKNLNDTFKVLVGATDDKGRLTRDSDPSGFDLWFGGLAGDTAKWVGASSIPGSIISNMAGPKQTGFREAFDSAHHSAYNLLVGLSGKSFSKAEMQYVMPFFTPTIADNREIRAFKLNSAHRLFSALAEAQRRGASADQRAQLFDSMMSQMASMIPDNTGAPAVKVDPAQQRLKNKYGLE